MEVVAAYLPVPRALRQWKVQEELIFTPAPQCAVGWGAAAGGQYRFLGSAC